MLENDLKSDFTDVHEISKAGWNNYLYEAQLNMDYYFDAQWTSKEQSKAERSGSHLYVINKMKRQINLLSGYEIKNRHILKIGPVEGQDDLACQQHTGVVMHLMSAGNVSGYDTLSDAFKWGPLISGSNLLEIWKDRNGDLKYFRHGFNGFLLDPALTQRDLSDCDNILLGQWVSKDKVKMLLPQGSDKIAKIQTLSSCERWDYLGEPALANKAKKRLYERWYRREIKYIDMVVHHITNEEITFEDYVKKYSNGNDKFARWKIENIKLPNGIPALVKYSKPEPWIRLTIFVDGEPVFDDKDPNLMDDYSFVWLNGDWAPEERRDELKLQGFASTLRDPQKARIRRCCQALDIIDSSIHNLRIMRSKYITNVKDAYKSGSSVPLHVKDDAPDDMLLEQIFQQRAGPDVNPGIFSIMEILDKDLTEAGGLNEEIFGSDEGDRPAILSRFRTGQALTGQAGLFQNYRSAKREVGRKNVRLTQLNYDENKIHRIINEWPTPSFYEPDFTKYDCTPTEGLITDSQQHLFYLEMKHLREIFPDFAEILKPSIIAKILPVQFKRELMRWIEQAEQAQKAQQQEQLQDKKRMDSLIEAQTAERIAEAQEDRSNALLDRVRAAAVLRKMNTDRSLDIFDRQLKILELQMKQEQIKQTKLPSKVKGKAKVKS